MRRRVLLCVAALACLVAAAFAALLANDLLAWRSAFDAAPAQSGGVPGSSGAVVPLQVARDLLGVQDDI
ncbi:MAG TPA: hypothetical protein VLJ76_06550, partial [Gaiellaceae bacterium]|nr:hypothetical protein [Gaiellaceae bacterium]